MARRLRRFRRDTPYEITIRTDGGRFALAPKADLVSELVGIFEEGARRTGVDIHFAVGMSTHIHLIMSAKDANQMGRWASFCFAQSARAAQFHHRLKGRIWGRRFKAIPILDETALADRVAYLMAQACCEGADLVDTPRQWVGLNAVDFVCRGVELKGLYLTAELRRAAVRKGKTMGQMYGGKRQHQRVLRFAPLPWISQAPHAQRAWFRRIEKSVIAAAKERRARTGRRCPHPTVYRAIDPNTVATRFRPSPAPECHSSCRQRRRLFQEGWRDFCALWGDAMQRFKHGLATCFPTGGWRPFGCAAVLPVVPLE